MSSPVDKRLRPLADVAPDSLVVHEIYASVQGESTHAGRPCVFVRTTACHLRCRWCDTPHAFHEGTPLPIAEVLARVDGFGIPLVELTGGEPLLQPAALTLMQRLCDRGYTVLLETSGSLDIRPVDHRVIKIIDLKAPGSGEEAANLYDNLLSLQPHDELKLVLADRADYEWAKAQLVKHDLGAKNPVLFSTVYGKLAPKDLAEWVVADKLPVRVQLQMHKYIWDPKARGV